MKHKAIITIEIDPDQPGNADIKVEMFPPVSETQDNNAAYVAMRMIQSVGVVGDD